LENADAVKISRPQRALLKPSWSDQAENADYDEIKRHHIIEEGRTKKDEYSGDDGDDGLKRQVIHWDYPLFEIVYEENNSAWNKQRLGGEFHESLLEA
jgi:hypothetical protein